MSELDEEDYRDPDSLTGALAGALASFDGDFKIGSDEKNKPVALRDSLRAGAAWRRGTNSPRIPFTINDIEVGARLVGALARQETSLRGMPITYGDLLTLARSLHPKDEVRGRAVPVGIGPKLLFVQGFCAAHGYPNLACLAVHRDSLRPAPGYQGDPEADRRAVADVDWRAAEAQLAPALLGLPGVP